MYRHIIITIHFPSPNMIYVSFNGIRGSDTLVSPKYYTTF